VDVKTSQTITFPAPGNKTYGSAPFNVSGSASSGLPVTFSVASGPATIAGRTVTLTGAGGDGVESLTDQKSRFAEVTVDPVAITPIVVTPRDLD